MSLCPTSLNAVLWQTKLTYLAVIPHPFAAFVPKLIRFYIKSRSLKVLKSGRADAVKRGQQPGVTLSQDDVELQLHFLPFF